jgi:hypothetical protein
MEQISRNKNIRIKWCKSFPNDDSYTTIYKGISTWADSKGAKGRGIITHGGIKKNWIVFKFHPETTGSERDDVYDVMLQYCDDSQTWSGTWKLNDPTPRDEDWIPSPSEEYKGTIEEAIAWNVGKKVFINGNWNEEGKGITPFKIKISRT